MKILLVIPKFGEIEDTEAFIPIGTAYINAAIRQEHFDVDGINLNYEDLEELKKRIPLSDVILCGGTSYDWMRIKDIFKLAKQLSPSIITIGGGAGYTSAPKVFSEITESDYAVVGEGERTIVLLLKAIEKNQNVETVKGIVYKKDGDYHFTGAAPVIDILDSIPFPSYEGLSIEKYFLHQEYNRKQRLGAKNYFQFQYEQEESPRELPMMLSRSCPFLCKFCFHTLGNKYRMRSMECFFKELDGLIEKYDINGIYLIDELFGLNNDIITDFCERISKYKLRWFAEIRVETASKSVLRKMKTSGCQNIQFGVENISNDILRDMNKKTTKSEIERALEDAYDVGMIVSGNILVGAENETWDTFIENFDWWNHHRIYDIAMINIVQYPGSVYYQNCLKKGLIKDQADFIRSGMPNLNMSMMSDYEWDKMNRMLRLARINKSFQGELYSVSQCQTGNGFSIEIECAYCHNRYFTYIDKKDWESSRIFTSSCTSCGRQNVYNKGNYIKDFQYELQQQWILNANRGRTICDWFRKNNIQRIAIWWNSELGDLIIDELTQLNEIEIVCVIDKSRVHNLHFRLLYHDVSFITEEEIKYLDAPCLLVCESAEFIAERRRIRALGYEGRIISSADLIFDHSFYIDDRCST